MITFPASLPGHLQYYLVTLKQYDFISAPRDLVGHALCGAPSPHLATDMALDLFKNPAKQPQIFEVSGGTPAVYRAFKNGRCLATVLPVETYDQLPQEEKESLNILAKTRAVPNRTLSVGKRLRNNADQLSSFLLSEEGSAAANSLLARYSKSARYFQRLDKQKFRGAEELLEGVVFGW